MIFVLSYGGYEKVYQDSILLISKYMILGEQWKKSRYIYATQNVRTDRSRTAELIC